MLLVTINIIKAGIFYGIISNLFAKHRFKHFVNQKSSI